MIPDLIYNRAAEQLIYRNNNTRFIFLITLLT